MPAPKRRPSLESYFYAAAVVTLVGAAFAVGLAYDRQLAGGHLFRPHLWSRS